MFNSIFGKQDERYRSANTNEEDRHYFLITRHSGNLSNGRQGWVYFVDGKSAGTNTKNVYEYIKAASPKMLKGSFYPPLREVQKATRELSEWSHDPIKLVLSPDGWYTDRNI